MKENPNAEAQRPRHTLPGIYKHYRGALYQVTSVAQDSNNALLPPNCAYIVVYVPLQLDGAHLGLRVKWRTEAEFHEWVCLDEGPFHGVTRSPWYEEQLPELLAAGFVPRFEYLGEELEEWMMPRPVGVSVSGMILFDSDGARFMPPGTPMVAREGKLTVVAADSGTVLSKGEVHVG